MGSGMHRYCQKSKSFRESWHPCPIRPIINGRVKGMLLHKAMAIHNLCTTPMGRNLMLTGEMHATQHMETTQPMIVVAQPRCRVAHQPAPQLENACQSIMLEDTAPAKAIQLATHLQAKLEMLPM